MEKKTEKTLLASRFQFTCQKMPAIVKSQSLSNCVPTLSIRCLPPGPLPPSKTTSTPNWCAPRIASFSRRLSRGKVESHLQQAHPRPRSGEESISRAPVSPIDGVRVGKLLLGHVFDRRTRCSQGDLGRQRAVHSACVGGHRPASGSVLPR